MQLPDLTDNDTMPFGKYNKSRTKMANVPAKYLLWLREQGCTHSQVSRYIEQNLESLKKEAGLVRR